MEFDALVVGTTGAGWAREIRRLGLDDLPAGDVLVEVERSGVNYKDALASIENGRVARIDPLVPGIDLAGKVVESSTPGVAAGDTVLVHGFDLGVAHHGGFSGFARVPGEWVVPMPTGLDSEQAMTVGTAGYTAALSVIALEAAGLTPEDGPVLVTGATGGLGSTAVGILAGRGYTVAASTGKADRADWLRALGATEVLTRAETSADSGRPLESERWAAAIDCVGGTTLGYLLRTLRYGGSVAASGVTGGGELATTVYPFILRGVNLLGIDSVRNSLEQRIEVWNRIATELRPPQLDGPGPETIGLPQLAAALDRILAGQMVGRVLVDPRA